MELSWWFSAYKTSLNIKEALINLNWSQCGWKWRCVFILCWVDRMNYIRNLTPRRAGNSVKEYNSQESTLSPPEGFCWGRAALVVCYGNVWKVHQCFCQGTAGAGRVSPKPRAPGLGSAAIPEQIMSCLNSPRKGKRVSQVIQVGAAGCGARDRAGDEASAEVPGPSRRQGSRQAHLW